MTELQESVTEDVNQDGQGSRAGRVRRFSLWVNYIILGMILITFQSKTTNG